MSDFPFAVSLSIEISVKIPTCSSKARPETLTYVQAV